jgi:hypothetical protein
MRPNLLMLIPPAFAIALAMAFSFDSNNNYKNSSIRNFSKRNAIIGCSPDWTLLNAWIEDVEIPPMPGSGDLKWAIETKHDSAQFYFNQGINTYYGFHIIEAKASFKKAAKFDSTSAMIYWAQALAEGPNINDVGYAASPDALTAVNKAYPCLPTTMKKKKYSSGRRLFDIQAILPWAGKS